MNLARSGTRLVRVAALTVVGACGIFTPKPYTPAPVEAPAPRATATAPVGAPAVVRAPAAVSTAVAMVTPAELATSLAARRRALLRTGRGMPADEVGYYLDVFSARVRQLRMVDLAVVRHEQRISVDLSGQAQFESGTAVLTPASRRALALLASLLKDYDQLVITVHAQVDPTGYAADDKRLSEQRALAVALQFTTGGVAVARLLVVGYSGDAVPGTAGNGSREGVVLWLDPLQR